MSLDCLQRYEEAIECYEQAITLTPQFDSFWDSKGTTLQCLKRYDEANICYDEAIKLNSQNANVWKFKGIGLFEMKQYKEALESIYKSIELNPNDENAWYWKAECLFELKQYEEAINSYDKATELDPNYQFAWSNKGYTYMEMKHYDKSALAYEKSRSINPQDLIPKFHLMYLYRDRLDKIQAATELFNSIDEQEVNKSEDKNLSCRYYLNKTEFELYNQNKGLAKESLLQAFEVLEKEDKLASIANEYWWARFGNIVIKKDSTFWLLEILEEKGYDVVLSPYYTAIQALEIEKQSKEDAEIYLNNRAVEISEPAREIIEKIRKYMD